MKQTILAQIDTFVFDVDGVLTDGGLGLLPDGTQMRTMNVKDGFGLQEAIKKGYTIIVISKGNSPESEKRLRLLGVEYVFMKENNKLQRLKETLALTGSNLENCVYTGDDIPDMECMRAVGYACCPLDAVEEVKEVVDYILPVMGGKGVARAIIKKVLTVQNKWEY